MMPRVHNTVPRRIGFVVVVALVAFTGCGVRTQANPTELDPDEVPFRLLEPSATRSPAESGDAPFALYFLSSEHQLVPVVRTGPQQPGPNRTLQLLLAGPTPDEAQSGLATAIPPGTDAHATVVAGDLVVIELAGSLVDASAADAVTAIAQLVFTVTERNGIGRVLFRVDGEPVEIPRGDGSLTDSPVERSDYASVTAPSS